MESEDENEFLPIYSMFTPSTGSTQGLLCTGDTM